jgi:hypothetical protein
MKWSFLLVMLPLAACVTKQPMLRYTKANVDHCQFVLKHQHELPRVPTNLVVDGMCKASRFMWQGSAPASPERIVCGQAHSAYVHELWRRGVNPVGLC